MSDKDWFLVLISQLDAKNIGDKGRLESIREYLKNGKEIYQTDKNYLITKYAELQKIQQEEQNEIKEPYTPTVATKQEGTTPNIQKPKTDEIDELKDQIKNLNEKVQKFEKIEEKKLLEKQITFQEKSLSTTLILSLVLGLIGLSGMGHMYVKKIGRGIAILVISLIMTGIYVSALANSGIGAAAFPFLIYIGIFIWQILDARKCCYQYNTKLGRELRQQ